MKPVRLYLSHRISDGGDASPEMVKENLDNALYAAHMIRQYCSGVELYVPAESEPFVGRAHQLGYITVKQILEIDCMILKGCDGLVVYHNVFISGGMMTEIKAVKHKMPIIDFYGPNFEDINNFCKNFRNPPKEIDGQIKFDWGE